MAWEYSEKTKRIFMDAVQGKPGTHLGEIENADGIPRKLNLIADLALLAGFGKVSPLVDEELVREVLNDMLA